MNWTFTPIVVAHMEQNGLSADDILGLLPSMLNESNPAPAVEQLDHNYQHGGGWHDFKGFTLGGHDGRPTLRYPGDPPMRAIAETKLRDERIILFMGSWVAVVQADGSMRVSRMD
jgi:hypothetical protein